MKKYTFVKVFDLPYGQVLVTKTIAAADQLPAILISTFNSQGLEYKVMYGFGTQIIRDESFEFYSVKHAISFLTAAMAYFASKSEFPQLFLN